MPHLDVNGARLYYETEGSDTAPALLLIHAGVASLRMWDPQVPALAQDHYVVRYDTRGFGNTTTEDIEFSDHADALAILDHLGVDRATVIGCSRGGRIAIDLAIEHPERVSGLVTIGSGPSGFPDTELTPEEDAISDRMDAAFEAKDWKQLGDLEVRLWSIGPARREEDLDPQFVKTAYELNSVNLQHAAEAASHVPLEPPAFDRVVDIDVPALILVGDHDVSECLAQYEYLSTSIASVIKRSSTSSPIIGEPEVVEDTISTADLGGANLAGHPAWLRLKAAAVAMQELQSQDGSVEGDNATATTHISTITAAIEELAPYFSHDAAYLSALVDDFERWVTVGLGVPDFYDSLMAFQPQQSRIDGIRHLVVFPMYTQNGSRSRLVEAVLIEVIWPEFISELEAGDYSNKLYVPIRFIDFTPGYDTHSATLFPETVAMREIPTFSWGAIFADREAARFRRVVRAAADITKLDLPGDAAELLTNQHLTEETFVMWDLIHDRTHMRGDLPFDPFMIKQRMPFFLYSLEELRCDLTAFRESVKLERAEDTDEKTRKHAKLVQYTVIFDRIFRFALTGNRVRNYDGLGGQLLFAWMHQHHVLHWTDTKLTIDWDEVPDVVNQLGEAINDLYWRSIDRPKVAHWLAAYELVSATVTPHPASVWAHGELPLDGPAKELTNLVMDDEFPLSMFFEALSKKLTDVIESTSGITAETE